MNKQILLHRSIFWTAVLVIFAPACALAEVSAEKIEQRTAFALGLEKGAFTISDLLDEGIRTNYVVKINTGSEVSSLRSCPESGVYTCPHDAQYVRDGAKAWCGGLVWRAGNERGGDGLDTGGV